MTTSSAARSAIRQADSAAAVPPAPSRPGGAATPGGSAVPEAARTVPPAPRPTACDWPTPCTNKWTAISPHNVVHLEPRYVRCTTTPTRQHQMLRYCATHSAVVEQNRQALIADRRQPELENWRDELLPPGGHWTPVDTVDTGGLL